MDAAMTFNSSTVNRFYQRWLGWLEGIISFYPGGVLLFCNEKSKWWFDFYFLSSGGFELGIPTSKAYLTNEWDIKVAFLPDSIRLHNWKCPATPDQWREAILRPLSMVRRGYWLEHTAHGWEWLPSPALLDELVAKEEIG